MTYPAVRDHHDPGGILRRQNTTNPEKTTIFDNFFFSVKLIEIIFLFYFCSMVFRPFRGEVREGSDRGRELDVDDINTRY